jgi:hypothetical protein
MGWWARVDGVELLRQRNDDTARAIVLHCPKRWFWCVDCVVIEVGMDTRRWTLVVAGVSFVVVRDLKVFEASALDKAWQTMKMITRLVPEMWAEAPTQESPFYVR